MTFPLYHGLLGAGAGFAPEFGVRFDRAAQTFLARVVINGDSRKYTISKWVERASVGTRQDILTAGVGSASDDFEMYFDTTNQLRIEDYNGGAKVFELITAATYASTSQYIHINFSFDSAQAVNTDRYTLTVDGVVLVNGTADFASQDYPDLNEESRFLTNIEHRYGRATGGGANYLDANAAEFIIVDGEALPATDFASGWGANPRAKDYTGPFGPEGSRLTFADNVNYGLDANGEGDVISNSASQYTGSTGAYNYSNGRLDANQTNRAIRTVDTFTGDFEFRWRYLNKANWIIGVYDIAEDGTYNPATSTGGLNNMTNSWYVQASSVAANNSIFYGGAVVAGPVTIANNDVWEIKRVGGTFSIYRNGALIHTWTQTGSQEVRLSFSQGDANADADQINWSPGTLANNFFARNFTTGSQIADPLG